MKIALLSVVLLSTAAVPTKPKYTCEKMKVSICRDIGYNITALPNYAGLVDQKDAEFELHDMNPIIRSKCSDHVRLFMCAAYLPMCIPGMDRVGPCRGLCLRVKKGCFDHMQRLGYPWPRELECDNFQHENDYEQACIMSNAI
ncbi:frizzled-4-like [Ostrinia nubilalis]|uniref:frizzled-4-like n=1 Tax=Ostrinia nubilalis TaxID=29057 RepID=UPI0030823295